MFKRGERKIERKAMYLMVGEEGFGAWKQGNEEGACSPTRFVNEQTAKGRKKSLPLGDISNLIQHNIAMMMLLVMGGK